MQDWLSDYSAALAVELPGLAVDLPPSLELADGLLNLARIIADGTGEKTNAPLSTFMVGRFVGSTGQSGISTEAAVALATEIAERTIQSRG